VTIQNAGAIEGPDRPGIGLLHRENPSVGLKCRLKHLYQRYRDVLCQESGTFDPTTDFADEQGWRLECSPLRKEREECRTQRTQSAQSSEAEM